MPLARLAAAGAAAPPGPPLPGPRRLPGEADRWAAAHAMRLAGGNVAAAAQYYVQLGCQLPAKWKEFATRWAGRFMRNEPLTPRKPSGRQPLLPDSLIRTIATEWMLKGVGRGSSWRPYLSVQEVSAPRQSGIPLRHAGLPHAPRCICATPKPPASRPA